MRSCFFFSLDSLIVFYFFFLTHVQPTKFRPYRWEVRVEYASDLDADVYGSGFATLPAGRAAGQSTAIGGASGQSTGGGGGKEEEDEDKHKTEEEEEEMTPHAWDFGELVDHPSNLLRVIGANIPGLTRPWLYLGMMFAAFCWHVEDHYLSSVNYLHAGAPKTWYGVPTAAAEDFERAVRTIVPSLVDNAPDLLHRLVTLVPPAVLRDAHQVEVFQTLQEPGEFVVTWPRAYHAGFSHGQGRQRRGKGTPCSWSILSITARVVPPLETRRLRGKRAWVALRSLRR